MFKVSLRSSWKKWQPVSEREGEKKEKEEEEKEKSRKIPKTCPVRGRKTLRL